MSPRAALLAFLGAAGAALAGFTWLASLAEELPDPGAMATMVPAFLLLLVPSALAAWLLPRVPADGSTFLVVLLVAAGARAVFLPVDPGLSEDVYRYLWDGRVQVSGANPYGVAPEDPALDGVEAGIPHDARVRSRLNHPEISTVYPPLLQHWFALAARLAGGVLVWKALLLIAELLVALLIVRALEHLGRDPRAVLLWLWHPLPVVEIAWNGHAEVLAVLPFLWCAVLLLEGRRAVAGVALGGAIAAKLLPIGYGLVLLRRGGVAAGLAAVATVAWLALPFAGVDLGAAAAGLGEYAGSWYFNDLLFRPLGALLGLDPEDRSAAGTGALRMGLAGAWVAVSVAVSGRPPLVAALWTMGAFVLFSPTVHPWYLLWVLPFAAILGDRAWWLLAGTVLVAYEVRIDFLRAGVWEESPWTRVFVYAAPLALMAWSLVKSIRRPRRRPPGPSILEPPLASPDGCS